LDLKAPTADTECERGAAAIKNGHVGGTPAAQRMEFPRSWSACGAASRRCQRERLAGGRGVVGRAVRGIRGPEARLARRRVAGGSGLRWGGAAA
jgi:hypothetical protein